MFDETIVVESETNKEVYCFLFQTMAGLEENNPWNVQSLYNLQFFNCPSSFCIYKNNSKQEFVNHAFNFHPESVPYLRNFKDNSLSDIEIPSSELKVIDSNFSNNGVLEIKTEEQIESKTKFQYISSYFLVLSPRDIKYVSQMSSSIFHKSY